MKVLQQRSERETKSIFSLQEIKQLAEQAGVVKEKIYNVIDSLNLEGFLLKKGGNKYQLVTANY